MTITTAPAAPTGFFEARLPRPRGPLSALVVRVLAEPPGAFPSDLIAGPDPAGWRIDGLAGADPFGEDLQLALYVCYELHYRGFLGVDPSWEWDPDLLKLRRALEDVFLAAESTRV